MIRLAPQQKAIAKKIVATASYLTGAYLLSVQIFLPFYQSLPQEADQLIRPGAIKQTFRGARGDSASPGVLGESVGERVAKTDEKYYFLDIPKLGIKNARIKLNTADLDPQDYIGHLVTTALPGQRGTSFLYGHSVLPWFFNPRDYNTIFSTLHNLDFGDSYTISTKEKTMIYEVVYKITLKPEEVTPFMKSDYFSKDEGSFVILMTCTPPGLDTKRLLVIGKLKE